MIFDTEMWHPNSTSPTGLRLQKVYPSGSRKGEVCVSILVSCLFFVADNSMHLERMSGDTRTQESAGSLFIVWRVW